MHMRKLFLAASLFALTAGAARADVNLWIDDTSGNIGMVDLTTGAVTQVHNTGQALTDIAFVGAQMFGTTFNSLVKINDATGASTLVGNYSVGDGGMNALVGDGASLLAASNATTEVYSVNPASAAAANFAGDLLPSAGDLAFAGKTLFLSGTNANAGDSLVNVSAGSVVGAFSPAETSVFGLANDGTQTFAVDGTEIFSVNTATAQLTPLFNYGGHGLGDANGTAFISENVNPNSAVPEPSTWIMLIAGFAAVGFIGYRRQTFAV
jgi:PEP-CTERM motif